MSDELSTGGDALGMALGKIHELNGKLTELMQVHAALHAEREQLTQMLDAAYPIIEGARLLRARYTGNLSDVPIDMLGMKGFDGVPKTCPDQAGVIIEALNNMEATCNFARVADEVPDAD